MTVKENRLYHKLRARKYREKNRKAYLLSRRKWYKKNKTRINREKRSWRKLNRKRETTIKKNWRDAHPWSKTWESIHSRVKYNPSYSKIYNYLNFADLKSLWFKYGADKMKNPRIHRLDSTGHYSVKNCKFIEFVDHVKLHHLKFKKKGG